MRQRPRYRPAALLLTLALLPALALADSRLRYQGADGEVSTFYVHDGKVRLEGASGIGSGDGYALFDARSGELTLVEPAQQRTTTISVERLTQWRDRLQQGLREQLGRLPPSQRQELEALLGNGGTANAPPPPRLEPTGRTERVAGYGCREYRLRDRAGEAYRLCLAPAGELGIPEGDAQTLQAMMRTLHRMAAQLPGQRGAVAVDTTALEGVPLVVREAGQERAAARLQSADTVPAAPGRFEVPADYRARGLSDLGG